jgi:hypothetical protein
MKINKYICLFISSSFTVFYKLCWRQTSAGYSDDIATNNLITKVSFENAVTDSKNGISGGVGTAVTSGELRARHIKVLQVRSFLAL